MRYYFVLVWICSPSLILGFGVQLEGLIDLGPNWSYKYKLSPISTTDFIIKLPSYSQKGRKDNEITNIGTENKKDLTMPLSDKQQFEENNDSVNNLIITQINSNLIDKKPKTDVTMISDLRSQTSHKYQQNVDKQLKNNENMKIHEDGKPNESDKDKKHIIGHKHDKTNQNIEGKLHDYMIHVKKQALKVWENILKITNSEDMKNQIEKIKKMFIKKFDAYMRQSQKHKMKTKLGSQKFILNTIDTSNRIMQRFVNSLSNYESSKNGKSKSVSIFQREINKEKQLEYSHACKKFGVCRTRDDFSDYLIELINIILQTNNVKIKQAGDALTEVVKTNDFTQTIDRGTQDRLRKKMSDIELWDPFLVKAMFVILRNVLAHKNQPIVIMDAVDQQVANKTVAFHEVIDTLNKNIYKSDNITDWNDIKKQLEEWRDGTRKEVQSVFHFLIKLIKKAMEKIDTKAKQEIDKNMNIILKPLGIIYGV